MINQNILPYNTIPHYIATNYRSGKLTFNQLILLLWLRAIGNPYGIATTSLDALRDDIFPKLEKNTVNSILLKLRKKHHVFYERRQGQKGSFDIHLNHWLMPEKKYKTIDKFFSADEQMGGKEDKSIDEESYPQAKSSEVSQKLDEQNQKLLESKNNLINKVSFDSNSHQIRSCHNEHENEHYLKNHDTLEKNSFKGTLVKDFQPNPNSYEENECKRIAKEIGDEFINPILDVLKTDGFRRIEQALGIFREHRTEGKQMDKPAAYFFGIINKLRKQQ